MNSSEAELEARLLGLVPASTTQLQPGFLVPAHPLWVVLVPYGLYLTFSSALCPASCLPAALPLAPLAAQHGTAAPGLMRGLSLVAAALHLGEAAEAWRLASSVYSLHSATAALWTLNVFLFGIFGFWPLAFPDLFYSVREDF